MGADIHAYVEYVAFVDHEGNDYWASFTQNIGDRNYLLFGLLAEVRGPGPMLFPLRGVPEGHVSYRTEDDYWLRVTDNAQVAEYSQGWTTEEHAIRWVEQGCSKPEERDGKLLRVTHPDWHSASWLTADELSQVLDAYAKEVPKHWPEENPAAPFEWQAVLAAMCSFEANGRKTRVIFWFDN